MVELPFRHNKEQYDNYVLTMLDEIKKINSAIQIDGSWKTDLWGKPTSGVVCPMLDEIKKINSAIQIDGS